MADLVSPIVDIISRLWTCCATQTRYLRELQENKDLLRIAMNELKEVRDDVQRRVVEEEEADPNEPKKRTEQVRGWLERVHTIEGEVEMILQKADAQQLSSRGRCVGGCCPPNNCCSNYKVGKSIAKKILPLVKDLKVNGDFQELTYRLPPPPVQQLNLESTVGMESMFDKVWRLINNSSTDDKPVRIMGLYGSGGVGKTTLLEKINNEFNKISEHDHVVIFVVVSKPINVQAIQTQIGERLRLSLQGDERRSANQIFNVLSNKKFVILLDDIWERVDLKRIGIPSPPLTQCNSSSSSSSSKVIFTTRSEKVCGLMEATHTFQVECLPWDKAWSLFQEKAGEKALSCFPGARELAKDVAKECGGLPLALITIGRAMSTKKSVEEWRDAIKTLRIYASKFEGMSDEVLARLKLSYDNLSDETEEKSCFCYCSLYPEDHSIEITQLIDYWIAEGFLDGFDYNLDEARDRGHTIIGNLKSACLLESDGEEHVKMHDVIRDLAIWIVNDCSSSSSSNNTTTGKFLVASTNYVCERWRNAERIFWICNTNLKPPPSPNLRTLLLQTRYCFNLSLPQSFFQFTPFLRVLDMSDTGLIKLPTCICELQELQYLNLSSTKIKELPVELTKLVKLKFLDLSWTTQLEKIPAGVIANLSELQVLKLFHSGFKDWGLKEEDGGLSFGELDRLKQLQEVTLNIYTSLALEELLCNQKLPRICTKLVLESWVNTTVKLPLSSTTISKGGLGNLTSLKYLEIKSCVELEELILFSNDYKLERLSLVDLPRLNNIVWGENISPFQNLYFINIDSCHELKDLTWLIYVENLKHLYVDSCKGLETIIELGEDDLEEGASGGCKVFRRLKTLYMFNLPNLKTICSHALVFPSIQTITIMYCKQLKKLPLDSRSNIDNTLQKIEGKEEWWNELQWEDETIKSKFLPYFQKN